MSEVTCETGASSAPSSGTVFHGSNGLRKKVYNATDSINYATLAQQHSYEELSLTLEAF